MSKCTADADCLWVCLRQVVSQGRQFGRGSLLLQVHSLSDMPLRVEIPTGSIFVPDDLTTQTLIASNDTSISIEPGRVANVAIDAYCGIGANACPHGA